MPTKIEIIMTADPSGKELVDFSKDAADRLYKDNLKRTQIRNIFAEAREIEALWPVDSKNAMRRLNMLKPKLAYQKKRKKEVTYLADVLTQAIDYVDEADEEVKDERFQRFMHLFEAILAYHRGR